MQFYNLNTIRFSALFLEFSILNNLVNSFKCDRPLNVLWISNSRTNIMAVLIKFYISKNPSRDTCHEDQTSDLCLSFPFNKALLSNFTGMLKVYTVSVNTV